MCRHPLTQETIPLQLHHKIHFIIASFLEGIAHGALYGYSLNDGILSAARNREGRYDRETYSRLTAAEASTRQFLVTLRSQHRINDLTCAALMHLYEHGKHFVYPTLYQGSTDDRRPFLKKLVLLGLLSGSKSILQLAIPYTTPGYDYAATRSLATSRLATAEWIGKGTGFLGFMILDRLKILDKIVESVISKGRKIIS